MNKKIVITVLIVLALLIVLVVWRSTSSVATGEFKGMTSKVSSTDLDQATTIENIKTREESVQENLQKKIKAFQMNSGNITTFLNDIYLTCETDHCKAVLDLALKNYPDREFAQSVQNLLNRMPNYEKQMQSTVLSASLSPQQKFEKLWQLRKETLGETEAKIGFGQEYDYAQYRFAYQDLITNHQLNPDQRLKRFEDLQLKYINVISEQGNIAVYEQALALVQQGKKPQEIEQLKQQLQQRYLNEQEKQDIQQRDQRQEVQQQQATKYQDAVKNLQNEMLPLKLQMTEIEWNKQYEQRLEQLRLNLFS